jgi:hypothetical protein
MPDLRSCFGFRDFPFLSMGAKIPSLAGAGAQLRGGGESKWPINSLLDPGLGEA